MGGIFSSGRTGNGSNKTIPLDEVWLANQTFGIQGQLYTLLNRRGGGTFGSVWESVTPEGQPAAVKIFDLGKINPNVPLAALINSFMEEVKMAFRLRDAQYHVANIYGFDFDGERRLALMALELGDETLQDRANYLHHQHVSSGMYNGDFISPIDRKSIWKQMVQIILVLHQHNIVHRDIKPANLIFFGPILKIVDLGIAHKVVAGYDSRSGGGTPYYSGPECFQPGFRVTSKADIWSLGAVLYHVTYGREPITLSARPPHPSQPPTRSPLVNSILHNCLQKNPAKRPSHRSLAQHPFTIGRAIE